MDPESAGLLRATVGHLLEQTTPGAAAADLYALGWADALIEDAPGAWAILFDEMGRRLSASPLLDAVVVDAVGIAPPTARVVYPLPRHLDAGSPRAGEGPAGPGVALGGWPAEPPAQLVVLDESGAAGLLAGPTGSAAATSTAIGGLDADLRLTRLVVEQAAWSDACWRDPQEAAPLVAVARTAIAQVLLGASCAMLDLATAYARDRHQFGRPIGSFQAVKHHLADVHVAVDSARSALEEAWTTGGAEEAELAKVLAGDAGAVAARWALQVMGAIGFTWEHVLHRYTRRVLTLDALLGSADQLRRAMGARLVETARVPRIGRL